MLILFDIDGTLLLSEGAGRLAMADAGRDLFGDDFDPEGVEFAGRLDPLIFHDLARANGVADPAPSHDAFRARYRERLETMLGSTHASRCLPGVSDLVDALDAAPECTLGIVTGNYPETGRLKVESAGLSLDRFEVSAWGIDGPTRRDLPRVAMDRYAARFGRPIDPEEVVVIGDTPHDVDCARANGCRVIAVATGPSYERSELAGLAPDLLVDDLSDTPALLAWLVHSRPE